VNLNVRSGPGLQFPILGVADEGTTGEVIGLSPDGDWYAVKVDTNIIGNGRAWVMKRYVTLTNPTGQALPTITPPLLPSKLNVPQPNANDPQVTMLETATIRQGPGLEYPVFGVTSTGGRAIVMGDSEDGIWWAIRLETRTGWVYKSYTYAQKTEDVPVIKNPDVPNTISPSVPGSGAPAATALEPINVRSGPGNTYDSYGKISIGERLAVIGRSVDREWLVVNLPTSIAPNGQGWVAARYVQAENIGNVPVISAP
jgi:N-acetylmuramoyl-L-alanine amidase